MKTLNPNDFGRNLLVENCQKIEIKDFLKVCRLEMKKTILNSEIEIRGLNIDLTTSKTRFNGERFWFSCPVCRKRAGVLYSHPITNQVGCRDCLGLDYAKTCTSVNKITYKVCFSLSCHTCYKKHFR